VAVCPRQGSRADRDRPVEHRAPSTVSESICKFPVPLHRVTQICWGTRPQPSAARRRAGRVEAEARRRLAEVDCQVAGAVGGGCNAHGVVPSRIIERNGMCPYSAGRRLSHYIRWSEGAPGRIRTCGLLLRRQTLYPLSYGGAPGNGVPVGRAQAYRMRSAAPKSPFSAAGTPVYGDAPNMSDTLVTLRTCLLMRMLLRRWIASTPRYPCWPRSISAR
jgi:hypothetical protein